MRVDNYLKKSAKEHLDENETINCAQKNETVNSIMQFN
jgi:hypothetical protein